MPSNGVVIARRVRRAELRLAVEALGGVVVGQRADELRVVLLAARLEHHLDPHLRDNDRASMRVRSNRALILRRLA